MSNKPARSKAQKLNFVLTLLQNNGNVTEAAMKGFDMTRANASCNQDRLFDDDVKAFMEIYAPHVKIVHALNELHGANKLVFDPKSGEHIWVADNDIRFKTLELHCKIEGRMDNVGPPPQDKYIKMIEGKDWDELKAMRDEPGDDDETK